MNAETKSPPTGLDHLEAHTASSLARRVGVSYTTVSRWLRDGQITFARAEDAAAFVVSRDEINRLRARSERQFTSKAQLLGDVAVIQNIIRRAMPAPPTRKPFSEPTAVSPTP